MSAGALIRSGLQRPLNGAGVAIQIMARLDRRPCATLDSTTQSSSSAATCCVTVKGAVWVRDPCLACEL